MTRFEEPNLTKGDATGPAGHTDEFAISGESPQIPKLFWAVLLVFSINLMIVIWFYFSPGFTVRLGGFHPEQSSVIAESKPSVFMQLVDETRRPLKTAMKVRPVLYDIPQLNPQLQLDAPVRTVAALDPPMPRATERGMPRASTPAMPRSSTPAALDIRRATELPMRHATTIEVRPHTEPPQVVH